MVQHHTEREFKSQKLPHRHGWSEESDYFGQKCVHIMKKPKCLEANAGLPDAS